MLLGISKSKDLVENVGCQQKDGKDSLKIMMVVQWWNVIFIRLLIIVESVI